MNKMNGCQEQETGVGLVLLIMSFWFAFVRSLVSGTVFVLVLMLFCVWVFGIRSERSRDEL